MRKEVRNILSHIVLISAFWIYVLFVFHDTSLTIYDIALPLILTFVVIGEVSLSLRELRMQKQIQDG